MCRSSANLGSALPREGDKEQAASASRERGSTAAIAQGGSSRGGVWGEAGNKGPQQEKGCYHLRPEAEAASEAQPWLSCSLLCARRRGEPIFPLPFHGGGGGGGREAGWEDASGGDV